MSKGVSIIMGICRRERKLPKVTSFYLKHVAGICCDAGCPEIKKKSKRLSIGCGRQVRPPDKFNEKLCSSISNAENKSSLCLRHEYVVQEHRVELC